MASGFERFTDPRPVEAMSPAQLGLILGLNALIQESGDGLLTVTCPRCAADGHPQLLTDNDPEEGTWKIDCRCRRRRVMRQTGVAMETSGDLLLLASDLLGPIGLVVRCPHPQCLTTPLTLRATALGVTATSPCGTELKYERKRASTSH